jgi:hypothetical protein
MEGRHTPEWQRPSRVVFIASAPLLAYLVVVMVFWVLPGLWILYFSDAWMSPSSDRHVYSALAVSLLQQRLASLGLLGPMVLALLLPIAFLLPLRWWRPPDPSRIGSLPHTERISQFSLIAVCVIIAFTAVLTFLPIVIDFAGSTSDLSYSSQLKRRGAMATYSSREAFLINAALPWSIVAAAGMAAAARWWWAIVAVGMAGVLVFVSLAAGFVLCPRRQLLVWGLMAVTLAMLVLGFLGLFDIIGTVQWMAFRTADALPFIVSESESSGQPGLDVMRILTSYPTQENPSWNSIIFETMYPLRADGEVAGSVAVPLVLGAWLDGGALTAFLASCVLGAGLMMVGVLSTIPASIAARVSLLAAGIVTSIWSVQVQAHSLLWQSYSAIGLLFLALIVPGACYLFAIKRRKGRLNKQLIPLVGAAALGTGVLIVFMSVVRGRSMELIPPDPRPHELTWLYAGGLAPNTQSLHGLAEVHYGPKGLGVELRSGVGSIQFAWDLDPNLDYKIVLKGRQDRLVELKVSLECRSLDGASDVKWIQLGSGASWRTIQQVVDCTHLLVLIPVEAGNALHMDVVRLERAHDEWLR